MGTTGWFPRSPLTDRRGMWPAMPLQLRHGYAADLHRDLPTGDINRPRSFPPRNEGMGTRRSPAQIHRVRAGGLFLRGVTTLVPCVHLLVSLAAPAPSGSPGASRRCRGCLPPSPASPGSGCPQLHRSAATDRWWRSLTSTRLNGASWRSMSHDHTAFGVVAISSGFTVADMGGLPAPLGRLAGTVNLGPALTGQLRGRLRAVSRALAPHGGAPILVPRCLRVGVNHDMLSFCGRTIRRLWLCHPSAVWSEVDPRSDMIGGRRVFGVPRW